MYSEQLAVLIFLAATQVAGHGLGTQPMAQVPRGGIEKSGLSVQQSPGWSSTGKQRQKIKREREAMLLAEFH